MYPAAFSEEDNILSWPFQTAVLTHTQVLDHQGANSQENCTSFAAAKPAQIRQLTKCIVSQCYLHVFQLGNMQMSLIAKNVQFTNTESWCYLKRVYKRCHTQTFQ